MKISSRKIVGAIASVFLAVASFTANASAIQFIYTGTGSGSLGGETFSQVAFTLTQYSDTTALQSCGGSCKFIDATSATVSIDGVGSYSFITGTRTFDNRGLVGFSRAGIGGIDLYNVFNVGTSYDMVSAIGPVFGNASLIQWGHQPVLTSAGTLNFDSTSTWGSFQAVTAVPEPETYAMMLAGLGLMGAVARRRKSK
jgi:hypothetical protein